MQPISQASAVHIYADCSGTGFIGGNIGPNTYLAVHIPVALVPLYPNIIPITNGGVDYNYFTKSAPISICTTFLHQAAT